MQVLTPGHEYYLRNLDESFPGPTGQTVRFVTQEKTNKGEFVTTFNGTTNEEVLIMLIDRVMFLNNKMHDEFNVQALSYLRRALQTLGKRAINRQRQEVEGTDKP